MPPIESYSTVYQMAFGWLMEHEGGYVVDHAGPTNMGIILRDLIALGEAGDVNGDGAITVDDIKSMRPEYAAWFFHREFWGKYRYEELPGFMLKIKIFDLAVVLGAFQTHKCVQRACRSAGRNILDDGYLGPISRQALGEVDEAGILYALRSETAGIMRMIVARRPERKGYLKGWLNRAYDRVLAR